MPQVGNEVHADLQCARAAQSLDRGGAPRQNDLAVGTEDHLLNMCAVAVQTTDGQIAVRNASFGEGRFGFLNDIENGRDAFIGHVGAHPEIHFLRTGILAVALRHAKDRIGRCSNEAAEQSIGHMHPCVVVVENFSSNWSGRL